MEDHVGDYRCKHKLVYQHTQLSLRKAGQRYEVSTQHLCTLHVVGTAVGKFQDTLHVCMTKTKARLMYTLCL
jgi:hypothetical protein